MNRAALSPADRQTLDGALHTRCASTVPPETEAGAASAFSQSPSLDGKRPGLVYFNLQGSAE